MSWGAEPAGAGGALQRLTCSVSPEQMDDKITAILKPFAEETGPARGSNPAHCDECREADSILASLTPGTVTYDDLTIRAWIFSFVSEAGLRWLVPGIVRAALDHCPPDPSAFFDLFNQKYDDLFTEEQWLALLFLADYCVEKGWMTREKADAIGPGKYMKSQQLDRTPIR